MTVIDDTRTKVDVLLRYSEEEWDHIRHLENQRATFTNLVLVVSVGIIGFVVQQGISISTLPLSVSLIVLGLFGALASYKFYERYKLHNTHKEYWLDEINRLMPEAKFKKLGKGAADKHENDFRIMSNIHVHTIWIVFNLLIVLTGILLTLFSLGVI